MTIFPALEIGVWNAWILMSVFLLQMLVIMSADRRVRQKTHVPTSAPRKGLAKHIALVANLVWLLAMVYAVFLPLRPDLHLLAGGLILFAAGLLMLVTATAAFMGTPVDRPITTGVYRFSRHPMYAATFLICLGSGVATGSWTFLALTVLIFFCFRLEAQVEEQYCLEKYGEAYREYAGRTPRWLGFPGRT